MLKQFKAAKKLLNLLNYLVVIAIDEEEYLHLSCLLEEIFPKSQMQMISSVINPKGNRRDNEFCRYEEYTFFIYIRSVSISSNSSDML